MCTRYWRCWHVPCVCQGGRPGDGPENQMIIEGRDLDWCGRRTTWGHWLQYHYQQQQHSCPVCSIVIAVPDGGLLRVQVVLLRVLQPQALQQHCWVCSSIDCDGCGAVAVALWRALRGSSRCCYCFGPVLKASPGYSSVFRDGHQSHRLGRCWSIVTG